ncbi:MAG TPA: hypothetical protein VGD71_18130 [Kribbella sp.]
MTLNITVLAEDVVYQSADFRLWNTDIGRLDSDSSTKIVTFHGREWTGLLTYTGIGRSRHLETAERVIRWLTGCASLSFEEIAEVVRVKGSAWLRLIRPSGGLHYAHTFVLAGFQREGPAAAVISNFESIGRPQSSTIGSELHVSYVSYRNRPVILVTGCVPPTVSRRQRRALESMVRNFGNDPARIRNAMRDLNWHAANVAGKNGMISEECVVQSFDRAGQGQQSDMVKGAHFRSITDGVDFGAIVEKVAKQLFGGGQFQLVGATSVTSASGGSQAEVCSPRQSATADPEGYELVELAPDTGTDAVARGVNNAGHVVGHSSRTSRGPALPVHWASSGKTMFLEDLGGISGQANAVNDDGVIIGMVEDRERHSHACRWDGDFTLTPLSVNGATQSGARSINDEGDIVGSVSFHPTDGGPSHFRPVMWQRDGTVLVMCDIPGDWGEAIAVNSRRQVLVFAFEGTRAVPILWQEGEARSLIDQPQFMIPVGLDTMGRVLGWTRDNAGHAHAMMWTEGRGWSALGTPPDWYVTAMNGDGVVVGFVDSEGFRRPWILRPEENVQLLPHYAYHFNQANAISNGGLVCGNARSDHGNHALVWLNDTAAVD